MPLLEVRDLSVRYDKAQILNGVSLAVDAGEFVGLVGPNGAGKSTLLRAISGLVRFEERMKRGTTGDIVLEGEIRFAGERIDVLAAHEIRKRGLVHCPERRRPFRELSVLENLLAGVCALPAARRAPTAGGRDAFRRRAADARDGALADVRCQAARDRRALARA